MQGTSNERLLHMKEGDFRKLMRMHDIASTSAYGTLCACTRTFPTRSDYREHLLSEAFSLTQSRNSIDDDFLKEVSEIWLAAKAGKKTSAVVEAVGCSGVSARGYIHKARMAGYLPPAGSPKNKPQN